MKLFNLDSPVMVFLTKVANLMILNLLTLICSIPIITIGHRGDGSVLCDDQDGTGR